MLLTKIFEEKVLWAREKSNINYVEQQQLRFPVQGRHLNDCVAQMVKNCRNAGDQCLIPGSGRSSGEGNSNPLQYFCLENPRDRETWRATVHGVAKSRTGLRGTNTQKQQQRLQFSIQSAARPECVT